MIIPLHQSPKEIIIGHGNLQRAGGGFPGEAVPTEVSRRICRTFSDVFLHRCVLSFVIKKKIR